MSDDIIQQAAGAALRQYMPRAQAAEAVLHLKEDDLLRDPDRDAAMQAKGAVQALREFADKSVPCKDAKYGCTCHYLDPSEISAEADRIEGEQR